MTDAQKRAILKEVANHPNGGVYHNTDPDVFHDLNELAPYVVDFSPQLRAFSYKGLSQLGESFLSQ